MKVISALLPLKHTNEGEGKKQQPTWTRLPPAPHDMHAHMPPILRPPQPHAWGPNEPKRGHAGRTAGPTITPACTLASWLHPALPSTQARIARCTPPHLHARMRITLRVLHSRARGPNEPKRGNAGRTAGATRLPACTPASWLHPALPSTQACIARCAAPPMRAPPKQTQRRKASGAVTQPRKASGAVFGFRFRVRVI